MKFIKKFLKFIIILAVIAGIVILGMKAIKAKRAKEAQMPVAKVYPMVVKAVKIAPSSVRLTLPYLALVENEENIKLSSRISARVMQIKKSGQRVKKGEILAKLDMTDIRANMDSLNISLQNLYKTHKRTKALYKVQGATIEQLQNEQSKIASLKAKLKSLQNQLSYATLISPSDGMIAKTYVSEGSVVMPGKPLLDISSTKGFSLIVRLPDNTDAKSILFKGKSYPLQKLGTSFHGLNEYKAFVDTPNLTAGESVDIKVVLFDGVATKLPFDAILDRDGKSYIFVAKESNTTQAQEVHIVKKGEEGVVIKENLGEKKIVIAKPDILLKLLSGISVKFKEQ